jgi:hypothetical protein
MCSAMATSRRESVPCIRVTAGFRSQRAAGIAACGLEGYPSIYAADNAATVIAADSGVPVHPS